MTRLPADGRRAQAPPTKRSAEGLSTNDLVRRPPLLADAVRRRWTLVAATTAFFILATLAYGQAKHSSYEANTTVIVYPIAGAPFSQQSTGNQLVDLSTEAQLVRSDAVARLAQVALVKEGYAKLTVGGLIARVSAAVENNAQVLRINYQAGAPRRARDGADAFAAAYLSLPRGAGQRRGDARSREHRRIAGAGGESADAGPAGTRQRVAGFEGRQPAQRPDPDRRQVARRPDRAGGGPDQASCPSGEVLSPATFPSSPHGTSPPILGGLGLLAGLVVGTIVAVGRERAVGRIRRPEALPDEPPVLAVVPPVGAVVEPVLLSTPTHRVAEAYRLLNLAVDAALPVSSDRGNIIAVASLTDPAPPVAINLALAAAESGRITTYVDALPRRGAPGCPHYRPLRTPPASLKRCSPGSTRSHPGCTSPAA